jgi:CIC family chloride channel protein
MLGVGYDYVDRALNGGLLLDAAIVLGVTKIAATVVSYAAGNPGGIFAPTLYIGAMTGAAVGILIGRIAPFVPADPGAYALVGMGAVFAGIVRAPLTSVFMIFELTQDYQIILPLMVANLLSFYLSKRFQKLPLYHALLEQDDVHLPPATGRPAAESRTAADVMTADFEMLPGDTAIVDAAAMEGAGDSVHLVGDGREFLGIVDFEELRGAISAGRGAESIRSLAVSTPVHAHPDHPIDILVERLAHSNGVLPIVSRADAKVVVGIVTVERIMRALRGASTPR